MGGRIRSNRCKQGFPCLVVFLSLLIGVGEVLYPSSLWADSGDRPFPLPKGLEKRVAFWEKVFGRYGSSQAIIHDLNYPEIIYEIIDFGPQGVDPRSRARRVRQVQWKYSLILRNLYYKRNDPSRLTPEERSVYQKWQEVTDSYKFLWAAQSIHCQWGIKDRFREGLIRSGRFQPLMRQVFVEEGLPVDLTYLPHVESSFNYKAYSRAGAAGIWQFIPSTGRLYLRIDSLIDERLDPIISTRAAARLLKKNFEYLGDWPLAITAYNYGLAGMLRAIEETSSRDLVTIIRNYRNPSFGYASKNFYAEFLAARRVAKNYEEYFGEIELEPPLSYETFVLPDHLDIADIKRSFSLSDQEIRIYNPSLLPAVLESRALVPKGFPLRIPSHKARDLSQLYVKAAREKRLDRQNRFIKYKVRRGDTLLGIARRFKLDVDRIRELNHLDDPSLLRVGQIIRLPQVRDN